MESTDIDIQDLLTEACGQGPFFNGHSDMPNHLQNVENISYFPEGNLMSAGGGIFVCGGEESNTGMTVSSNVKNYGHIMTPGAAFSTYSSPGECYNDVQSSNVSRSGDPIHVTQCPVQATSSAYHQGESETRAYHDVQYKSYFEDYHKERTNNCGAFISPHCSSNKSEQINERQSGAPYAFTESPSSTMCISQHFRSGTNSRSQCMASKQACVFLCNRELWSKFHNLTTEMIVSRRGR
jgi:hypothetical protein